MKRRAFLKMTGRGLVAAGLGSLLSGATSPTLAQDAATVPATGPAAAASGAPDVVLVENGEPAALLQAALKEMGGMGKFVSRGDVVVVKPNIGWDRPPELAGDTNPELVAEVVKECLNAGAKVVKVFDRTCNNPLRCYANSGIEAAAAGAGAEVTQIDESRFKTIGLKNGEAVKSWDIYQDYLEADKIINVPIAKHHGLARVTLGLKNLMGVMGGQRGQIHNPFDKKLNDIAGEILPTLTIIDAYRMLMNNGPSGGNPADVKLAKTLIMSPCTVSADLTALSLFGLQIGDLPYLQEAVNRKMLKFDPTRLNVKKVALS